MCEHCTFKPGHQSFGASVPGFAQGAYYPGDEPGNRCDLTGELCDGKAPIEECGRYMEQCGDEPLTCPACLVGGEQVELLVAYVDGGFICPECELEWEFPEVIPPVALNEFSYVE